MPYRQSRAILPFPHSAQLDFVPLPSLPEYLCTAFWADGHVAHRPPRLGMLLGSNVPGKVGYTNSAT